MSAPLTFPADDELALAAPRRLALRETSPFACIGGKGRGQVLQLAKFLPSAYGSVYEPFMGGMNMSNLLIKERWISPNKCRASDQCKELVDFFVASGLMPPSLPLGIRRRIWNVRALDLALDILAGIERSIHPEVVPSEQEAPNRLLKMLGDDPD